ncbi:MAG: hypothetical protein WAO00_02760 [Chthoniobacterales bacterium]
MNVTQLIRFFLIISACGLIAGCASEDDPLSAATNNRAPVAGESTPPPASGGRTGWAW